MCAFHILLLLCVVDFAIGLVNYVLNLTDGQVKIFRRIKITEVL